VSFVELAIHSDSVPEENDDGWLIEAFFGNRSTRPSAATGTPDQLLRAFDSLQFFDQSNSSREIGHRL